MNEFDIIDRYFKHLTKPGKDVSCGIGDDAAIIDIPAGHELVVSVDTLVSGVHFSPGVAASDLGFKALAVNLSDLAAMGAVPKWATLALTIAEYEPIWMEGFARGFSELAMQYGISLVGGDTTRGPLSVTIQIMGLCQKGTAMKRSGAEIGDDIYVSGYLGEAGYALQKLSGSDEKSTKDQGLNRLLRPQPRIDLSRLITGTASASIDISDGLAADLRHILTASSVGAMIDLNNIPLRELLNLKERERRWQTVLSAGDDYELCFTAAVSCRDKINRLTQKLDYPLSRIGTITNSGKLQLLLENGEEFQLDVSGYQHFR